MSILPTIVTPPLNPRKTRSYSPRFVGFARAIIGGSGPPEFYPQPGDMDGVGRDAAHKGDQRLISVDLDIPARNAIVAPNFLFDRIPGALVIDMPRGTQNPVQERVNIVSPKSMAYGDLSALTPDIVYTDTYAKLV